MAAFGVGPLIAASLGVILMGLLRTPLRWSGRCCWPVSVAWAGRGEATRHPDSGDGRNSRCAAATVGCI